MVQKVWIALLVSIVVTILISIINWLSIQSIAPKSERNKVSLMEPHWLFLFGLLVSKGIHIMEFMYYLQYLIKNNYYVKRDLVLQHHLRCDSLEELGASLL